MKIVCSTSMSFSGSSLLNLLMNTQPTVVGLGEIKQLRVPDKTPTCYICGLGRCELYDKWNQDKETLWEFCRRAYGDRVLFVKGYNKTPLSMFPSDARLYRVILSKDIFGIVDSFRHHHPDMSPINVVNLYYQLYQDWIRRFPLMPRITYRTLAENTDESIERLMRHIDEPFSPVKMWTDLRGIHVIGGNPSIVAQANSSTPEQFNARAGVKYQGRFGKIFYDDCLKKKDLVKRSYQHHRQFGDQGVIFEAVEELRARRCRS